jgi:P27 family predicted phage terminase small subunit
MKPKPIPEPPPPEPPVHLSLRAQALWRQLVPRRAKSPERLTLLQAALEALDRADRAREAIEREGLTVRTETTGAMHIHPLVRVEEKSRQAFGRIWRDLGLTWAQEVDGLVRDYGQFT